MAEPIIPFFMKYPIPQWQEEDQKIQQEKDTADDLLYFLQLQSKEVRRLYMEIRIYLGNIMLEDHPLFDAYPDGKVLEREVLNFLELREDTSGDQATYDLIFGLFSIEVVRRRM